MASRAQTYGTPEWVQSMLASFSIWLARAKSEVSSRMPEIREVWGERAAIREFCGGMPRAQAEAEAVRDTAEVLGIRIRVE